MMDKDLTDLEKKIVTYEKKPILTLENMPSIVLVGGCFDVIHFGHVMFLQKVKKQGSVVVALESDEFIQKRKKRKPIHTQDQRAQMLAAFQVVDVVVKLPFLENFDDYGKLVADLKPTHIGVTRGDSMTHEKEKHAHAVGASLQIIDPVSSPSTTTIIDYASISRH